MVNVECQDEDRKIYDDENISIRTKMLNINRKNEQKNPNLYQFS